MRAKIHLENLTIEILKGEELVYWIDLERCRTPAEILDWIFQIHHKAWCTPDLLKQVLDALEDACGKVFGDSVQNVFCPFGAGKEVNWELSLAIKGGQ